MKAFITSCVLLLASSSAAAATWIVDASGGGDFTSIQVAIEAAAPGDVLIVKAGSYGAFTLDRDLSIIGVPGPRPMVSGKSTLLADSAAVAGLRFASLDVLDAAGFVLLDDVELTGQMPLGFGCEGSLIIEGCAQVHIARSFIHGKDGDAACESRGLKVSDSIVTLTASTLVGGTGWGDDFIGYPGIEGLDISGESFVLLSQTNVYGGNGGSPDILFGGSGGNGAEAIRISWGDRGGPARCTVRGSGISILQGGDAGLGIGAMDAWAVASGYGTLTLSGVAFSPPIFSPVLDVVMPVPAQPFLTLVGNDGPSGFKRLNMHGPAGTPLLLFASLHTAKLSLPGPVDGVIWLDLATPVLILPVVLLGQETAVNLTSTLPPVLTGLEGLTVTFQGFAQGLGATGNHLATNPVHLLVR